MFLKMKFGLYCILFSSLMACNNSRVIEAEKQSTSDIQTINPHTANPHTDNAIMKNPHAGANEIESGKHEVEVLEVLQSPSYTYIRVKEEEAEKWLVTLKMDVETGEKYEFEGGLLKKDYQSKELDKKFDEIYLIGGLKKTGAMDESSSISETLPDMENLNQPKPGKDITVEAAEGITPLSDILKDPKSFKGKIVTVQGICVKVNNEIMDRNWVHLQDGGTTNGKLNDLTITTKEIVEMGASASFTGKIVIDQDFGAGYTYDVLLEAAILKM